MNEQQKEEYANSMRIVMGIMGFRINKKTVKAFYAAHLLITEKGSKVVVQEIIDMKEELDL